MSFVKLLCIAATIVCGASGQLIDLYTTPSFDGSNVYATGVIQYGVSPGCTMCMIAYHTYADTITITSPSGRQASCNFNQGAAASQPQNLQCEASLGVDSAPGVADLGDWSIEAQPSVYCSIMGWLISQGTIIDIISHLGVTTTYYAGCSGTWYSCNCKWLACSSGIPTCQNTGVGLNLGSCSPYMVATYLVFYIGGVPICAPPVGTASGKSSGPCS
jgi:hypothetical protein